MAARVAPTPVRTFLVVMAAVTLGLIVTGIRVQDAVFSERSSAPSTAPKPAVGVSVSGALRQDEGSVNVPKAGDSAQGSGSACARAPAPHGQHNRTAAACREVSVTGIPVGSRIVSISAWVKESETADWRTCSPYEDGRPFMDCGIEDFRFLERTATLLHGTNGITVSWIAMNLSDAHSRDAQVLVQYAPPVTASQK